MAKHWDSGSAAHIKHRFPNTGLVVSKLPDRRFHRTGIFNQFCFHQLKNKNGKNLDGYFAIDVKSRTDPWRIILRPLDNNKRPFVPCHIDEVAPTDASQTREYGCSFKDVNLTRCIVELS